MVISIDLGKFTTVYALSRASVTWCCDLNPHRKRVGYSLRRAAHEVQMRNQGEDPSVQIFQGADQGFTACNGDGFNAELAPSRLAP